MTFKKGDKVYALACNEYEISRPSTLPEGTNGKVVSVNVGRFATLVYVQWDNGEGPLAMYPQEIKLKSPNKA